MCIDMCMDMRIDTVCSSSSLLRAACCESPAAAKPLCLRVPFLKKRKQSLRDEYAAKALPYKKRKDQCQACCQDTDREGADVLLCDGCEDEFHFGCVDPPVSLGRKGIFQAAQQSGCLICAAETAARSLCQSVATITRLFTLTRAALPTRRISRL